MSGNKITVILLVIALVASGVQGYFIHNHNQALDSQKLELSQAITELSGELANARQVITDQGLKIDANQTALNSEILSLQAYNATRFVALEEKVKINQAGIDAGTKAISALENEQNSLSYKVDTITPGLAADTIYAQVSGSVVQITDGEYVYGTGFIYDNTGRVMTAAHVIEGISDIYLVLSDGMITKASIFTQSPHSDVAILQMDKTTTLTPAQIADPDSLAIGDYVLTIGHPLDLTDSLTVGVVSQLHRFENIGTGGSSRWVADLIQFDAAVNPGNSGGPLFDSEGKVVGMVVARIDPAVGNGISLAVSSARLSNIIKEMGSSGRVTFAELRLWVFAESDTPSAALTQGANDNYGVFVAKVFENRLGIIPGILPGDKIVMIDNTVIKDIGSLTSYMMALPRSTGSYSVTVKRGYQQLNFVIEAFMMTDDFNPHPFLFQTGSNLVWVFSV